MSALKRHTFIAEIRPGRGGGAYTEVPFDVEAAFTGQGVDAKRPTVKATIDGHAFTTRLMTMGHPSHFFPVPKEIRERAGKTYGDTIRVTLEADTTPREVVVPLDLQKALASNKVAREFFETLAYTGRKEYARWIADAKKPDTRERRVAKAIEMLLAGKRGV
jgi:Bacteriocin-protection, YdeI or OmpD-Associated/Domain of unknown function (DUF1905)